MQLRSLVSPLVVCSLLGVVLLPAACGDDSADTASDDDGADDGDDAADDDDQGADDDTADDDVTGDDDATGDDDVTGDDDDGNTTTFETDAGTVQVIFGGDGEECGGETCLDGTITQEGQPVLPPLNGCCVDESTESCGLDLSAVGLLIGLRNPGCEALGLPGSADETCESSPPLQAAIDSVNGIVLPGCCQATGQCGYLASIQGLGFGCLSPTRFGQDEGADCTYAP